MFRAVLRHRLGQLVIHISAHALGSIFFELTDSTDNFCLDRPLCWKRFNDRFTLEPYSRFSQDRRENTTSPVPRLRSFFILHAQNF